MKLKIEEILFEYFLPLLICFAVVAMVAIVVTGLTCNKKVLWNGEICKASMQHCGMSFDCPSGQYYCVQNAKIQEITK